jgi:archaellum component FlaC
MATPDNTQPPNVAELTPQQIADQIAEQAGGEPAQLQREYVVETSTGSVFRGRTQQEVIDAMKKSVEHGSETIKSQKDELERIKDQLSQQAPYLQQLQKPPENYTPQRYYELWAQDPNIAEDYRLQMNYGVTQAELAQQIQQAYQFTNQIKPEVTMRSWMATSDFPTSNPEELEKASNAFERVWNEFYPQDFDFTPQKLEQVHAVAVKRGLYQPEGAQQTGQVELTQPSPASQMPTLNTGTSGGTGQQQEVNRMTPEQIRGLMEQIR